jgi:hypothetical protein
MMDSSGRSRRCNRVLFLYFLTRVDRDKDGLIREVMEL